MVILCFPKLQTFELILLYKAFRKANIYRNKGFIFKYFIMTDFKNILHVDFIYKLASN